MPPLGPRALVFVVAVLGVLSICLVYGQKLNGPPIRSDGMGYYLYLPAALIDHDLTLRTTIKRSFGREVPEWAGVNRVPETDRLFIKYPIGEAILLIPFFAVAQALALASGVRPDGFAPVYHNVAAVAALTYVTIGLWILRGLLAKTFAPAVVFWTLLVVVFGTNLFHYVTYDSLFSHGFSFFLFTLFLYCTERWHARPAVGSTVALAVVAGLITLVRPTNSVVFVFASLYGVSDWATWRERARLIWREKSLILTGVLVYLVVLVPQFAYWHYATGHWVIFSYTDETFDFAHPELTNVLFSVRKGLFFWSPLLLLAVAGFWFMWQKKRVLVIPTFVFMPLNLWVIASWHDWAYGGSFGHRAFTESAAIFAFGYASLLQSAQAPGRRRALIGVSIVLTLLSAHLMTEYWRGIIPFDRTTWPQFVAALWRW